MIEKIKKDCVGKAIVSSSFGNSKEYELYNSSVGLIPVRFLKDENNEIIPTFVEIIEDARYNKETNQIESLPGVYHTPCFKTLLKPEEFLFKFSKQNEIKISELQIKRYFDKIKLKKPEELKGIEKSFTIPISFGNKGKIKASAQAYIKNGDVYLKINDYFSEQLKVASEDIGTEISHRINKYVNPNKLTKNKFIYGDNYGEIILQNKAWVKIENLNNHKHLGQQKLFGLLSEKIKEFYNFDEFQTGYLPRFYEKLTKELIKK